MTQLVAFIIEDNKDEAKIFAASVAEAGFKPLVFRAGESALVKLEDIIPALVVLDLHLPGISGMEILSIIRMGERARKVPVIVVSGDAAQAKLLRGIANFVLLKPVGYHQLRELASRFQMVN